MWMGSFFLFLLSMVGQNLLAGLGDKPEQPVRTDGFSCLRNFDLGSTVLISVLFLAEI